MASSSLQEVTHERLTSCTALGRSCEWRLYPRKHYAGSPVNDFYVAQVCVPQKHYAGILVTDFRVAQVCSRWKHCAVEILAARVHNGKVGQCF